ncbi:MULTISPECIES: HAD family hydrolase [Staphylococcus]|uniref:HAD family hydrolase n=1 Tax=Staphylococcus schleiferi TaxID=1295 RepID=A0A7Z7VXZ6_STASC|nr:MULTISPECIES: HAD family hydrolase [Staphylococcus]QGS46791.1 HAD-IA family hydrolase [Mammaliicoccus fleurettii]EPD53315.1 HAD hydrolase, family IA [Staphylococcus sp. HGB0015]NHA35081.1 HAD family hydrolase [Staphylococcus schleiferi]NHA38530.1 HAD family hydrolase [Staphylococcus schleiferi]NHA40295.1 HAD family hydrolase [Staphylococcus schleiferi]
MTNQQWILFDKDGTLIHFDQSWTKIGIQLVDEVCAHYKIDNRIEVYHKLGIRDHQFVKGSIMASGTLKDMINVFNAFTDVETTKWVSERSQQLIRQRQPEIELYEGVQTLLYELKQQSYQLGLVTSDNAVGVDKFIKTTQLEQVFDLLISTEGDQYEKPDARLLQPLWDMGVQGEALVMVGDTDNDMLTGKNAGSALNVGVRTGLGQEATFEAADVVIDDVSQLLSVLDKKADQRS